MTDEPETDTRPPDAAVPPAATRTEVVPRANRPMWAVAAVTIAVLLGLAVAGGITYQRLYDEVTEQGDDLQAQADRLEAVQAGNTENLHAIRRQNRRLADGVAVLDRGVDELARLNEQQQRATFCTVGMLLIPPQQRVLVSSERIARLCGLGVAEVEFLRAAIRDGLDLSGFG